MAVLGTNPGASLSEVAVRAGVGRATLHRHFPSREALLRDLAIAALDATDAACAHLGSAPTARDALELLFAALVPLGNEYHFLARCPVDDPEVSSRYARQLAGLEQLVIALRGEGLIADDVPDSWAVSNLDWLVWAAWSAVANGESTERDACQLAVRTALLGLGEGK
ncbi:MAG: TetR/AcrR family transcriptional regulator [Myxococcota bacterium]